MKLKDKLKELLEDIAPVTRTMNVSDGHCIVYTTEHRAAVFGDDEADTWMTELRVRLYAPWGRDIETERRTVWERLNSISETIPVMTEQSTLDYQIAEYTCIMFPESDGAEDG